MVKSRSAFISVIIFFLIAFSEFKKNIKEPDRGTLHFNIRINYYFCTSSSWVVSKDISIDEEITDDIKICINKQVQDNKRQPL